MAGRIDSAQKDRLVAAGQWEAFQRRRDELKTQGLTPDDARVAAYGEVMRQAAREERDGDDTAAEAFPTAPEGLPTHATADEPTVVRWVARNVDNPEPDPATCPDPFAWTLLRTCRENPAFLPFFVEKLWAKLIPARSQLDGAGPKEFDGKLQLELIDRIEAMRDEAMRGAS